MFKKLKEIYHTKKEVIAYIFFGALTTLVSYVSYFAFRLFLDGSVGVFGIKSDTAVPVVLSWVAAVTFAYLTNRVCVFKSKIKGFKGIMREAALFYLARAATLAVDFLIMILLVDLTGIKSIFYEFMIKLFSSVIVLTLNYFLSKVLVFKKNKQ